jgi:hypothetical protein
MSFYELSLLFLAYLEGTSNLIVSYLASVPTSFLFIAGKSTGSLPDVITFCETNSLCRLNWVAFDTSRRMVRNPVPA